MPAMKTAVGPIDKEAFKKLSRHFDTTRITKASRALNEIRLQMGDIDDLQKGLHKLHNMAMYLFNDDDLQIPTGNQTIWGLAYELSDEIFEWKEKIDDLYDLLCELEDLAADEDDIEEGDIEEGDEDDEAREED